MTPIFPPAPASFVQARNISARYGDNVALTNLDLDIPANQITAFIGPSGCGKTTFLRCINRMNDLVPSFSLTGDIVVDGIAVYTLKQPAEIQDLRRHIGMIFQRPNPLPMSIMENMLFPVLEHRQMYREQALARAIENLKLVGLYDEVSNRLEDTALALSGGQQQRLCIARALMMDTKLLLLDEPCSALDPVSTFQIEELLEKLKKTHTLIMVTHNMEQARRISDKTAFFYQGRIVEVGDTARLFTEPAVPLTESYIAGRRLTEISS